MQRFITWFFNTPTPTIAILSLVIAFVTYRYQRKKNRIEKACEIANSFAKSIIPKIRFVGYVLDNIELTEYIHKFSVSLKSKQMVFLKEELETLLTESEISDFDSRLSTISADILKPAILKSGIDISHNICYNTYNCSREGFFTGTENELYSLAFGRYVYDLINELEAMAMLLNYKIADHKVLYQSLHGILFRRMKYLYYFIACSNRPGIDRSYDNICRLFTNWYSLEHKKRRLNFSLERLFITRSRGV